MERACANHPEVQFFKTKDLKPHPENPRKVTKSQVSAAKKGIKEFGFNTPLLLDSNCPPFGSMNIPTLLAFIEN